MTTNARIEWLLDQLSAGSKSEAWLHEIIAELHRRIVELERSEKRRSMRVGGGWDGG